MTINPLPTDRTDTVPPVNRPLGDFRIEVSVHLEFRLYAVVPEIELFHQARVDKEPVVRVGQAPPDCQLVTPVMEVPVVVRRLDLALGIDDFPGGFFKVDWSEDKVIVDVQEFATVAVNTGQSDPAGRLN